MGAIVGRKPLIVMGMIVQGVGLALLVLFSGSFAGAVAAAGILGAGTALAYPTLLALVSDAAEPRARARALARYRFWRDTGLVAGALLVGLGADAFGAADAIVVVAATGHSSRRYPPYSILSGRHAAPAVRSGARR